jgi:hypothetical protein
MREVKRPEYFFGVSALDVGFVDRTFYVGGYVDFQAGVVVVEGEGSIGRATTQQIADMVEARERAQWGDGKVAGGRAQPAARVSDVDHRLVADLRVQHGLEFRTVERKNFEADVNLVNVLIQNKQLLVSEKCVELRRQLREGVYAKGKRDMARDGQGGHYDGLAALRYFVRVAEPLMRRSPLPEGKAWRGVEVFESPRREREERLALLPETGFGRQAAAFARGLWKRG